MKSTQRSFRLNTNITWLILLVLIAACSSPQTADHPGETAQTASQTPSPEPTALPSTTPTLTPSPSLSPSPTPSPPTATPAPVERITFTIMKNIAGGSFNTAMISFVNSNGTGLESPALFTPFYDIMHYGFSGYLAWSPDGRFLAFDGADACHNTEGGCFATNYGIVIADYAQNTIIRHVVGTMTNPSWAPDSQRLALSLENTRDEGDLGILDIQTGQVKRITSGLASDFSPSWSPDGQWIAFVRYDPDPSLNCGRLPLTGINNGDDRCNYGSLYIIRPDGSDLQRLFEPVSFSQPAWSPDSQWLAFLSFDTSFTYYSYIFTLNIETGESELVAGEQRQNIHPAWSPDGKKLAFASRSIGENYDLYLWDTQEKITTQLTNTITQDYRPAWSWSGAHIAFISEGKLWVMNADGTDKMMIDGDYEYVFGKPVWQP